ncbi:helix-turn-helix transcriptional regulator [Rhodopseudomonas palustris]|uniref:helix-turn-helix transcriptional regulator n=1 Tax=Rhodopseudomonas palustris TaxID=1076 RepID=UPI0018DB81E6|nr:AlpA family phage regulatory protein [Rhodopseudomonas palustris]
MARYTKANELLAYLGFSRSTLSRHIANDPTFPRPIFIGRTRRFDLDQVEAWLAARPTTATAANENARGATHAA